MKQLLLFGPFLWLRKVILYLICLVLLIIFLLYFVANSSWLFTKIAQKFAPEYHVTYTSIKGNLFTGLKVENLAYEGHALAKHIVFRWNPNALSKKEIVITKLEAKGANIDNILAVIDALPLSEDNSSTEPLAWAIHIKVLAIDIDPLQRGEIEITTAALVANDIWYVDNNADITQLTFKSISNLTHIDFSGKVEKNRLHGGLKILPKSLLFTQYELPIRSDAIKELNVGLDVTQQRVIATLDTKVLQLLDAPKDAFNLDIDSLKSTALYRLNSGYTEANTTAIISTPYAKNIQVTNSMQLEDKLTYSGTVFVKKLLGLDAKFSKPIDDLTVYYSGDESSIDTQLETLMLKGTVHSDDLKTAALHLESKEEIVLAHMLTLPTELNATKVMVQIDAPLTLEENATQKATVTIVSNVLNVDANVTYDETLTLSSILALPKDSLLKSYTQEVQWDKLTPIKLNALLHDNQVKALVKVNHISSNMMYDLNDSNIDGNIKLGNTLVKLSGKVDKKLNIDANIDAMSTLFKDISTIYKLEDIPKIDGGAKLKIEVDALKSVTLQVKSSMLRYHVDSRSSQEIKNLNISLGIDEKNVVLKQYDVTYDNQRIFSTKPSLLTYKDDTLTLNPLWVNDTLNAQGEYNLKTKKGTFTTSAKKLHLAHELVELDVMVDIKSQLDGNQTAIEGKVTLLGGEILYDLNQKTFASDSDIIIVQDMKKEEASPFMEYLKVALKIQTQKPLHYHKDAINIKAKVDIDILKEQHSELLVLGDVEILKGGSYIFENKKFILDQSHIYFTGNPKKPLLDMSVHYKALEYIVTIKITGSADLPHIAFSAKPSLNKEQILSLILFDTVEAAGTNSGDEMMKMMGGAMAKSALNDMGVQIDHLVLGEGNSIEVGKKLTDKITIIYINGKVAKVKLKYEHSPRTESVIGVSEESQSYDIIYKRDF